MAALTLADMYLMSPYMLEQGIIKTLQEESQLADTLSFENIQALTVQTYRSGKLNPVSWRKIKNYCGQCGTKNGLEHGNPDFRGIGRCRIHGC